MRRNLRLVLSAFVVFILAGAASADIFYAASNYNMGSVGVIRGSSQNGYTVSSKLVVAYNGDTQGFSFHDHNGDLRVLVRERASGIGDRVYIYDPANFASPMLTKTGFGSNIHAVASDGADLYITTYESYPNGPEDTGEVVHVDMRDGYAVKHRYQNPKFLYNHFLPEAGSVSFAWPHGEGVMVHNNKVYVMYGMSDPSKVIDYAPTEIVEFSRDLTRTGRKAVLWDNASPPSEVGKNSLTMAMYNGKLYVGCIGGRQGTGVFGDIWEVDLGKIDNTGVAGVRQVLDFENVTGVLAGAGWGAYGLDFTKDGTAFILAGGYDSNMDFKGRLFKIPGDKLAAGDISALESIYSFTNASGHSWWDGVTWDEKSDTVWVMAGTHLFAFDKDGSYKKDFDPAVLGEDIYSVALFNEGTPSGESGGTQNPPAGGGGGAGGGGDKGGAQNPPVKADDIVDKDVEVVSPEDVNIVAQTNQTDTVKDVLDAISGDLPKTTLTRPFRLNEETGQLEADALMLEEGMSADEARKINRDKVLPLPVFHAAVTTQGKIALVSMTLDLKRFAGNDFEKLLFYKMGKNGTTVKFGKAAKWADITDGRFIVTDISGMPQSGEIKDQRYTVSIAVEDDGDYDWNTRPGQVMDPGMFALEGDGGDNDEDNNNGGGNNNNGGDSGGDNNNNGDNSASDSGGGGGCAMGAGGLIALAAFALTVGGRKQRKRGESE